MTSILQDPRWLALSEARRDELLNEHRNTNVDHGYDWWDSVYEGFIGDLKDAGIEITRRNHRTGKSGRHISDPEIFFSGFWSQGDGACFGGYVGNWGKFMDAVGKPEWCDMALEFGWSFTSTTSHRMGMEFSSEFEVGINPYDEDIDALQHIAWNIRHQVPSEVMLDRFSDACRDKFNDLAHDLYRNLEEEYEYLTSDEVVVEYILEHCEDELIEEEEEEE